MIMLVARPRAPAMSLLGKHDAQAPLQVADPEEGRALPVTREELVLVQAPRSQIAEQFRALRNSIVALNPEGAPRTLVVTSALRGEGKTVAAVNLALALAEMPGNQLLVVDANLHTPGIESLLGLPRRQGLAELLSGRLPLDKAIRSTSVPGVAVLGAGANPRNPSELLASERMRSLLRSLKQRFNYVVVDTPEATTTSDASVLGAIADGILLVVRQGTTPRHHVEAAHNQLEALGGHILGVCLTGAYKPDTADEAERPARPRARGRDPQSPKSARCTQVRAAPAAPPRRLRLVSAAVGSGRSTRAARRADQRVDVVPLPAARARVVGVGLLAAAELGPVQHASARAGATRPAPRAAARGRARSARTSAAPPAGPAPGARARRAPRSRSCPAAGSAASGWARPGPR